ncbi:MAG: hypothetical protein NZ480_06725, partial [Bdellovibrionaceae bacterium]|nr:hypothetical protein [Pseudobdellovibrionaceae bacterium]
MFEKSTVEILQKSPTRIDLVGGTLDLWPIYTFLKGAWTWNVAIDIFSSCTLKPRTDSQVHIQWESAPCVVFKNVHDLLNTSDQRLLLLKEVVGFFSPSSGFELSVQSESPVGAGLGGSSSLLVTLLKTFYQWLKPKGMEQWGVHEWVRIAHNLEARILGTPTGTQDYYPAWEGKGLCGL